jgi:hypothetical protein
MTFKADISPKLVYFITVSGLCPPSLQPTLKLRLSQKAMAGEGGPSWDQGLSDSWWSRRQPSAVALICRIIYLCSIQKNHETKSPEEATYLKDVLCMRR